MKFTLELVGDKSLNVTFYAEIIPAFPSHLLFAPEIK